MMDTYQTETRESGTMSFRIEWVYDHDSDAPWDRECGHGPVSEWTTRDKRPGEMILCSDRHSKRFYDFATAVKTARVEGWDTAPYKTRKPGERAQAAVMADFERLRLWCDNQWHHCGIVVTLLDADGEPDSVDASLWGIESDSHDYHEDVIGELITDCLSQITSIIGE
jgi:hypothetical protein